MRSISIIKRHSEVFQHFSNLEMATFLLLTRLISLGEASVIEHMITNSCAQNHQNSGICGQFQSHDSQMALGN